MCLLLTSNLLVYSFIHSTNACAAVLGAQLGSEEKQPGASLPTCNLGRLHPSPPQTPLS